MERGEPVWLEEDRAAAMAWGDWMADLHVCGQPLSETAALKLDEQGRRVPAHDYDVDSGYCAACVAVNLEREAMSDDPLRDSIIYAARRVD